MVADVVETRLSIGPLDPALDPAALPPAIAWPAGEFGTRTGTRTARGLGNGPSALRYYDSARDYQPGLQRAAGRAAIGGERTLELPATLSAQAAGALIDAIRLRSFAASERTQVRVASLDPAFAPGRIVAIMEKGLWRVEGWEWRSGGIELDLARVADTVVDCGERRCGHALAPCRPLAREHRARSRSSCHGTGLAPLTSRASTWPSAPARGGGRARRSMPSAPGR